ncbi:MAG: c-type cytochrome, partial [candidate division NC10 bacterium]|nr:c-type cytochrome [candidate division NC10 bacterium]
MGRKKSLFAISILTVMMLGCGQSLTAQAQQEPAKPVENGQQPKGSEASATVDQQKPKKLNPFTGNADAVTEGRQLYLQSGCPGCHGSGGGGAMAGATPFIRDAWKFGGDDETYFKVI